MHSLLHCTVPLSLPPALKLTVSSADNPPHDLVSADGRRLVLDVEPQRDELILDAVVIVIVAVLLGGLDDLAV